MRSDPRNTNLLRSDASSAPGDMRFDRVIGSGLSRTGTRSIYAYLIRNGWPTLHYPFDISTQTALERGDVQSLWPHMSILDLPSALAFEKFAAANPGTIVVHSTREFKDWVTAVDRHYQSLVDDWNTFPARFTEFSEWISCRVYGSFPPSVDGIAHAGQQQEQRVAEWKRQHPERLIVVNVFTGEGFPELTRVLMGRPTVKSCIPHITDADEVPLSLGLDERTLLWTETR